MIKPELLAPAGSKDALIAAIEAKADAVYFGGKYFGARNLADNFDDEKIEQAIDFCHERGVKAYVTVNTVYRNDEIKPLLDFVSKLHAYGADAFIFQDIGCAVYIKENIPEIKMHASTQMTAHSLYDAEFLADAGFSRIVLSRELPLCDISEICDKLKNRVEIEVFVHGALCVSYSGQCFMSSFLGGRSGNRGDCAQPCRLRYSLEKDGEKKSAGHLLSTRDLCSLPILDKIISSGVNSIKIEGRMKSPEYVFAAVRAYREALDSGTVSETSQKALYQVFNRGGDFTEGYFENYSGQDMMSFDSPKPRGVYFGRALRYSDGYCDIKTEKDAIPGDGIYFEMGSGSVGTYLNKKSQAGDKIQIRVEGEIKTGDMIYKSFDKALMDGLKRDIEKNARKLPITGKIVLKRGEKACLTLKVDALSKTADSQAFSETPCETAEKAPIEQKRLDEQVRKMGQTPFILSDLVIEMEPDIYINMTQINEMRRQAAEELRKNFIAQFKKSHKELKVPERIKETGKRVPKLYSAKIGPFMLDSFIKANSYVNNLVKRVYIEYSEEVKTNCADIVKKCHLAGLECFIALPHINRNEVKAEDLDALDHADGFLARNYGFLHILKNNKKPIVLDYTFHCSNILSNRFFKKFANSAALSRELSIWESESFSDGFNELIAYGKPLFMITNQCLVGNSVKRGTHKHCELKGNTNDFVLSDRTGAKLKIMTNCDQCLSYIYNDRPFFIINRKELSYASFGGIRIEFIDETEEDMKEILIYAQSGKNGKELYPEEGFKLTYGHFFRKSKKE